MAPNSLPWRHNGRDSVSNDQPHDCLHNRSFRRQSKKTSKLRVTGLCAGNSPRTGEFPAQMASYVEKKFPFDDVIMFRTFTTGGYFIIRQDTLMQDIKHSPGQIISGFIKENLSSNSIWILSLRHAIGSSVRCTDLHSVCWLGSRFASSFYKWENWSKHTFENWFYRTY